MTDATLTADITDDDGKVWAIAIQDDIGALTRAGWAIQSAWTRKQDKGIGNED